MNILIQNINNLNNYKKQSIINLISKEIYCLWGKPLYNMSLEEIKTEYVDEIRSNKTILVYVLLINNELAGHIFAKYKHNKLNNSYEIFIKGFFIIEKYRNQGFGKVLFKHFINKIHEIKPGEDIYLEDGSNIRGFYKKMGFNKIGKKEHIINNKKIEYDLYLLKHNK